jgi:hypothetical protein
MDKQNKIHWFIAGRIEWMLLLISRGLNSEKDKSYNCTFDGKTSIILLLLELFIPTDIKYSTTNFYP